jgi:hypothetical protein
MFQILNGEKTSVLGDAGKRQRSYRFELYGSSPEPTIDSFMNVHRRGCLLFYIQVPRAKAKEMQYTGGLLSLPLYKP